MGAGSAAMAMLAATASLDAPIADKSSAMRDAPTVFRVKLRGNAAAVPIRHVSPATLLGAPGSTPWPLRRERKARRKARMRLWARRGRR